MIKKLTVFVDMDGVLTNFVKGVAEIYALSEDELLEAMGTEWDITKALGVRQKEMWEFIHSKGTRFWSNLEAHEDGIELIRWLHKYKLPHYIATSPSQHAACLAGKFVWMQKTLSPWHRDFFITPQKWLLAPSKEGSLRVLIDDSPRNCRLFEDHGGKAILYPRSFNGGEPSEALSYTQAQLLKLIEE